MTSGLIIPGSGRSDQLRLLIHRHNTAVSSMTPPQLEAMRRLIVASVLTNQMVGDAPPEVQRGCAQEALSEVIRREGNGQPVQLVMWSTTTVDSSDDAIDRMLRATDSEAGHG
jgi:hypothetical protein